MRSVLLYILLALTAGAAGFGAYRLYESATAADHPLLGQPAPDVVLAEQDGRALPLSNWRGRWVLVNFWASWCAPCMEELPLLVEAQRRYGAQGLQIVGPALDEREAVSAVSARLGITYPVMADFARADAAMQALGNTQGALPYSVLIDPAGRIQEIVLGALSADRLEKLITRALDSSSD